MIKALLIDDDPIQLRLAELLIRRSPEFGESMSYSNAEQALQFLGNKANRPMLPDVILLDLNMPLVDGWSFLSRYSKMMTDLKKQIALFIVSSSIDKNDMLRSKRFPFVKGFISKPISPEILQDIASQLS